MSDASAIPFHSEVLEKKIPTIVVHQVFDSVAKKKKIRLSTLLNLAQYDLENLKTLSHKVYPIESELKTANEVCRVWKQTGTRFPKKKHRRSKTKENTCISKYWGFSRPVFLLLERCSLQDC